MRSPALLSLILGALAALGFAPMQLWALTLVAFAGWLLLVHAAPTWRAAAWRGWLFGVGHFTVNNNWIQHAFDFQDAMPPLLGYAAPIALALYLAVFPMSAALILWRWRGSKPDAGFALLAGAAWIATEWTRSWLFTGYPWDPLAAIWLGYIPVAGLAAWVGTYALSGLTVTLAGAIAVGCVAAYANRYTRSSRASFFGRAALSAMLLVGLALLAPRPTHDVLPDTPRLVVVQPDINQNLRGEDDSEPVLRRLIALSGGPAPYARLVLWPEGMVRDYLESGYPDYVYGGRYPEYIRPRLARVLGPRDTLLLGATPLRFDAHGEVAGAANSVQAIGPDGELHGRYDKAHLVPYGEYLPIPWLLKPLGLARLVPGGIDFDAGPGPRNVEVPGIGPVGIQLCYEIVFSGRVVDAEHRPRLLFNPSNDAWFGRWGPPQHLAQARLRAIEEGLPIVRATPTGISAVIAADGMLLGTVPLGRAGVLTVPLPQPLPPTLFARLGNWLALIVAAVLVAGAVAIRWRRR